MIEPDIEIFPDTQQTERLFAIFGVQIPYLPEPLATEFFVNQLDSDYQHRLRQQIRFIKGLHLHSDSNFDLRDYAIELRFVAGQHDPRNPFLRHIAIFILGRVTLNMPDRPKSRLFIKERAVALYKHIGQAIPIGYTVQPLNQDGLKRANPFLREYLPLPTHTAEIRKFVDLHNDTVYPFAWSDNSFAQICKVLMQADGLVVLSVCIQPSELEKAERNQLQKSSVTTLPVKMGMEFGQDTTVKVREEYLERLKEARDMPKARIAEYYLHRLRHPFLIRIQLVADHDLPASLLRVVGEEISSPSQNVEDTDLKLLPVGYGYEYLYPQDEQECKTAFYNFFYLQHQVWGDKQAEQNAPSWRLRYLVDATEANCAFRFPLVTPYGVPGIATIPFNPFSAQYQVREKRESVQTIRLGQDVNGVDFELDTGSFLRHALVVGSTGSGKTTTCQTILAQLWKQGCPFLVIEPVKSEYRRFLNFTDFPWDEEKRILFFTLGDLVSPFHFNPFEIPPGVSVGTYISALKSCFMAAFPLEGPMSIILERAIREAYRAKGWGLEHRVTRQDSRRFPTLSDLCWILKGEKGKEGKPEKPGLITRLGYSGEIRQNLEAALTLRLTNLRDSLLGQMIDVERTSPWGWDELLGRPVVLEFDAVVDEDEKALVIALIFVVISFYRKTAYQSQPQQTQGQHLAHLTLIEEAHRLFASTGQRIEMETISSKAKAITVFTDMLAEMRALGEGILVAEQIPTKLVSDIIKHPDIKIMHRITADEDRRVLGESMNFSEQHRRFVTTLKQGMAAVYVEGLYAPVLVTIEATKLPGQQSPSELELFGYMVVRQLRRLIQLQEPEVNVEAYLNQVGKRLCALSGLPVKLEPRPMPLKIKKAVKELLEEALKQFPGSASHYPAIIKWLSCGQEP